MLVQRSGKILENNATLVETVANTSDVLEAVVAVQEYFEIPHTFDLDDFDSCARHFVISTYV